MAVMNRTVKQIIFSLAALACTAVSQAQIGVNIRMNSAQILAGENVLVGVTITNNTGNDIVLANQGRTSWLDMVVKRGNGEVASGLGNANFGAVKIGAGQTVAKTIDISKIYNLREPGSYSVSAIIRDRGTQSSGYISNRLLFTCATARPDWSQKVGVPGSPGKTREYRVINFTSSSRTKLYAQLIDGKTGTSIQTLCLGEALLFRKPQASVDRAQVLHVLYLATPEFYVHARMDVDGKFLGRDLHKRGANGDPRLMTFGDGSVKVAGSVLYDAAAAAQAQAKIRKISERPPYVYN